MTDTSITPRADQTRTTIIDAAHLLFLKQGYHGTSMRQIAEQAEVALGGIYNHFTNKEELFEAVLEAYHPFWRILPAIRAAKGEKAADFIRDAARRMVAGLSDRAGFLNLMFIELVEFRGRHIPHLYDRFFPEIMTFGQNFLVRSGELRPIPLPILIRAFMGIFFAYVLTDLFLTKRLAADTKDNALDYFVDIFLYGVMIDKPPQPPSTLEQ